VNPVNLFSLTPTDPSHPFGNVHLDFWFLSSSENHERGYTPVSKSLFLLQAEVKNPAGPINFESTYLASENGNDETKTLNLFDQSTQDHDCKATVSSGLYRDLILDLGHDSTDSTIAELKAKTEKFFNDSNLEPNRPWDDAGIFYLDKSSIDSSSSEYTKLFPGLSAFLLPRYSIYFKGYIGLVVTRQLSTGVKSEILIYEYPKSQSLLSPLNKLVGRFALPDIVNNRRILKLEATYSGTISNFPKPTKIYMVLSKQGSDEPGLIMSEEIDLQDSNGPATNTAYIGYNADNQKILSFVSRILSFGIHSMILETPTEVLSVEGY
jgi:hypothetical protein